MRNCRSVIYYDTPTRWEGIAVGNGWIFETEIPKQTWAMLSKPCHLQSPETKIPYGCQSAMLTMTSLKINRLLRIYPSMVLLKFGVDIQSQTKVTVRKPKIPKWLPGFHSQSDVAENQWASGYGHNQQAHEIGKWNSKANLTYAPETMSSTHTDGRTDGRIRWIQNTHTPPPHTHTPNSLARGIIMNGLGPIQLTWINFKPSMGK